MMRSSPVVPLSLSTLLLALAATGCPQEPTPSDSVPRATATADRLAGTAPLTVSFVGEGTGGDEPLIYAWDFGDGETATTADALHTFVLPGSYQATLRVTDADGDFDEDALTVDVTAAPLSATPMADPSSGRAPLSVQFSVGVQGGVGPYTFEWDFADGNRSSLESPTHTFAAGGQFDVLVTVQDSNLVSASGQVKVTVASDDQPAAALSASPTSGIAPLTVAFEGRATGGNAPLSFSWDFGDGATADRASTSHTYQSPGTYTALLTVVDADGDQDSRSVEIVVTDNSAPSVSVSANPDKGIAPLTVAFTSSVSGGDAPLSFAWIFGDGSTSTLQNPSHTYATAGTYTAQLTVTDANGDPATASAAIEVGNDDVPIVSGSATPSSGRAPLTVSFNASAQGGNAPLSFAWDFGDGGTSTLQNPSHTFSTAGTYQATVQVSDADGDTDSTTVVVNVTTNAQPQVTASASPSSGREPLPVSFFASVQGGDAPLSWQWSFGDGSPGSTTQNPTHTYAAAGTYQAQVTVMDADGDADSAQLTISVSSNSQPTARAFADVTQGIAPLKVNFSGSVTGGNAPITYDWAFGNGATGSGQATSYTYPAAGSFTVVLTVTDADGDQASDSLIIGVASNQVPTVSATATPASGAAPLTVAFDATASGGDAPLTYAWDFGDGSQAAVEDPSHTYGLDGVYNASVIVTDANGDSSSATVEVVVQQALPDYAISGLQVDVQGSVVVYSVTVQNAGNTASPGTWVDFYYDRVSAPAIGDFGDYTWVDGLAAGASTTVSVALSVQPGTYQAWAQIDANDDVTESNETNGVIGPVSYEVFGPMLINEVFYDSPGADTGTFVELSGPPGTSLDGYALVGVNGADGSQYVSIDLTGLSVRSDGFLVVAQDGTVDPTQVDLVNAGVDLQNGPDNLLLTWNANVLDAVGYGVFGAGTTFSGELAAAPGAAGKPLGRPRGSTDTDDNSVDFVVLDLPSPGAANPVVGDTCAFPIPLLASGTLTHSTAGAVDNYHALNCGGISAPYTAEPDVVYEVVLTAGQTLTAELTSAATGFDSVMYLRSNCTTQSNELVCDDDGAVASLLSKVVYTSSAGGTYYLIVDGYGGATDDFGTFSMTVNIQ
ncbi:MAG: PKD domain-containing protein [Deltaproteobacteria bacterium]|nr:PKD domain-containing protein [Deltaproteobacteria bacterium]